MMIYWLYCRVHLPLIALTMILGRRNQDTIARFSPVKPSAFIKREVTSGRSVAGSVSPAFWITRGSAVAVVGDRMKGTPGISAKVFGALGIHEINVIAISQGSSEVNISLIVAAQDAAQAVLAIHQAFELQKPADE